MYQNWRDLIKPKEMFIEEQNKTYGKFICEPLERGFGQTLGNSMRRILLSSLIGSAITAIKVDGVQHEFTNIPDITEDITNIVLNLKKVRLKMHTFEDKLLSIDKEGEGELLAGHIITDPEVEILNPDLHIATMGKGAKIKMELHCQRGRGYSPAEQIAADREFPIGTIPIDAIFNPIKKVSYTVTNARVKQKTDYDKLSLELWTDGSLKPEQALALAGKILDEHLSIFTEPLKEVKEPEILEEPKEEEVPFNENLLKNVNELELSVRSANCLQNAEINLIGDLVQKTEADMLKTKNFGRKSLKEIKEILLEMGLSLGMKPDGWSSHKSPNDK